MSVTQPRPIGQRVITTKFCRGEKLSIPAGTNCPIAGVSIRQKKVYYKLMHKRNYIWVKASDIKSVR